MFRHTQTAWKKTLAFLLITMPWQRCVGRGGIPCAAVVYTNVDAATVATAVTTKTVRKHCPRHGPAASAAAQAKWTLLFLTTLLQTLQDVQPGPGT